MLSHSIMPYSFDLARLKKKKCGDQQELERLENQAKERWDRITQSILNILPPPMTDA